MVKRARTKTEDRVVETLMQKQDNGFDKYNTGIQYQDNYNWIDECIEELADGLQYAVSAKMRIDDIKNELDAIKNTIQYTLELNPDIDLDGVVESIDIIKKMLP